MESSVKQLPRLITIKVNSSPYKYICYKDDCSVMNVEDSVLSPRVKIEVERAKIIDKFVHLRFSYSNRYWHADGHGKFITAVSTQPEENIFKPSCTLFEAVSSSLQQGFTLVHVRSGKKLMADAATSSLYLSQDLPEAVSSALFEVTDWSTLVKLPRRVAFKGYNGKYLKAMTQDRYYSYHKFASDDPNEKASGYEVQPMNDGHVRIKSDHWGMFWRRSPNWIWGDSADTTGTNRDTLFWPVQIDDKTIALRNAGNNNFCMALTTEGKVDCLNAAVSTITNQARLVVEELVFERKIHNVRYRMKDSRIFDEAPYLAGSSSVTNNGDQEASMRVEIEYQNQVSYTFSNSLSITTGVSTTFQTGVPCIVNGEIEVSMHINSTLQWARTTTTTQTIKASGSVAVPPRSVAKVNFIGTKGSCTVPFSYTQQDRSSTDGKITETHQIDGAFTGVNCYNFSFQVESVKSLPASDFKSSLSSPSQPQLSSASYFESSAVSRILIHFAFLSTLLYLGQDFLPSTSFKLAFLSLSIVLYCRFFFKSL